jgi:uncharacterized membrane protein
MRRARVTAGIGLLVVLLLLPWVTWGLAVVIGWNAAALAFLGSLWPIIVGADGSQVQQLATREDETRGSATVLLVGASVGSLLGVGYTIHLAGRRSGSYRDLLIGAAVLTVVLSWTVVNTVFTLRYAHLYYRSPTQAIVFDDSEGPSAPPTGTLPISPLPSVCATRSLTPTSATPASAAPSCGMPCCRISSAW